MDLVDQYYPLLPVSQPPHPFYTNNSANDSIKDIPLQSIHVPFSIMKEQADLERQTLENVDENLQELEIYHWLCCPSHKKRIEFSKDKCGARMLDSYDLVHTITDVVALHSNKSLLRKKQRFAYFEITWSQLGKTSSPYIGWAASAADYPWNRNPGSYARSWAVKLDTWIWAINGSFTEIASPLPAPLKENDTVGLGYDRFLGHLFSTLNGVLKEEISVSDSLINFPTDELVACTSMRLPGEKFRARFKSPFTFNLSAYEKKLNENCYSKILTAEPRCAAPILSLVTDYLEFHGYSNTLKCLKKSEQFNEKLRAASSTLKIVADAILSRKSSLLKRLEGYFGNSQPFNSIKILLICQEWIDFLSGNPQPCDITAYFKNVFLPAITPLFKQCSSSLELDYLEKCTALIGYSQTLETHPFCWLFSEEHQKRVIDRCHIFIRLLYNPEQKNVIPKLAIVAQQLITILSHCTSRNLSEALKDDDILCQVMNSLIQNL